MTIKFINSRKQELSIGSSAPFMLQSSEGFGDVSADMHSQNAPYMDGSIFIDSTLQERSLSFNFTILADSSKDLMNKRRFVSKVLNPRNGLGTLRYEKGGFIYEITAIAESIPQYPSGSENRGMTYQRVVIDLIAPDPYWRSLNQESKPLQAYVGNFKLPMTFPFELGVSGSSTTLYNDGDAPAPVQIKINGPTTNPQIFNRTTGEYIRINRTIAKGEVMNIDTTPGQKSIIIESEEEEKQAFGYLDPESTLWDLEIGENEIEHVADSGNRHAKVFVKWQNRFVGV